MLVLLATVLSTAIPLRFTCAMHISAFGSQTRMSFLLLSACVVLSILHET